MEGCVCVCLCACMHAWVGGWVGLRGREREGDLGYLMRLGFLVPHLIKKTIPAREAPKEAKHPLPPAPFAKRPLPKYQIKDLVCRVRVVVVVGGTGSRAEHTPHLLFGGAEGEGPPGQLARLLGGLCRRGSRSPPPPPPPSAPAPEASAGEALESSSAPPQLFGRELQGWMCLVCHP